MNLADGACMAHPPTLFAAMRGETEYPVPAVISPTVIAGLDPAIHLAGTSAAQEKMDPRARQASGLSCGEASGSERMSRGALFAPKPGDDKKARPTQSSLYPVKAFFAFATNTLMNFANQQGILAALENQDLLVVYENFLTPTAQLADYVLPGDCWMERETLGSTIDIAAAATADAALLPARDECKDSYWVVRELAQRLGLGERFTWANSRELFDYRLAPSGLHFADLIDQPPHPMPNALTKLAPNEYATPSGKIELSSSILKDLGYDPLPHYDAAVHQADKEAAQAAGYPLEVFIGLRERTSYNTCLRQIKPLRSQTPEPLILVNPTDAITANIADGTWCRVETTQGSCEGQATYDGRQPSGTLRVPHGWWKPEEAPGLADGASLSAAMRLNDGLIASDAPVNLDPEQGLPNLRGGIFARLEV
jgi:anaerobic selenocysteine-containing dehydrogenase